MLPHAPLDKRLFHIYQCRLAVCSSAQHEQLDRKTRTGCVTRCDIFVMMVGRRKYDHG